MSWSTTEQQSDRADAAPPPCAHAYRSHLIATGRSEPRKHSAIAKEDREQRDKSEPAISNHFDVTIEEMLRDRSYARAPRQTRSRSTE